MIISPVVLSMLDHSLSWYRFIGRMLGRAMYEGIPVDVTFTEFFLAKVCATQPQAFAFHSKRN